MVNVLRGAAILSWEPDSQSGKYKRERGFLSRGLVYSIS
jgi:hypothetical protein